MKKKLKKRKFGTGIKVTRPYINKRNRLMLGEGKRKKKKRKNKEVDLLRQLQLL